MSISGNVGRVGHTSRIEVTSEGAVVIPISDYKIVNASKLNSSWVPSWYHTTHNRASYVVCKICYDSKDNDGTVRVKNDTDNTKNHEELRAILNPANTSAVILHRIGGLKKRSMKDRRSVVYCIVGFLLQW